MKMYPDSEGGGCQLTWQCGPGLALLCWFLKKLPLPCSGGNWCASVWAMLVLHLAQQLLCVGGGGSWDRTGLQKDQNANQRQVA